ncbi:MAG: hypothetical protein ACI8WB_005712 [Phenylobacterium sp.]|jgi:hypothetical protein
MLRHYPSLSQPKNHQASDYYLVICTFYCLSCVLVSSASQSTNFEWIWALFGWLTLATMLRGEPLLVRLQVLVAIVFATLGEFYASVYMGGYIYQYGGVPAYVPAGHGMVYLSAIALGRSALFQNHARAITVVVVLLGSGWSLWGLNAPNQQTDVTGSLLFCIFLLCLLYGRNPMVYLGAFFVTSFLEIVGTGTQVWYWVVIDPASGLPQGNPPSGVAAYYCMVDAVAIGIAPILLKWFKAVGWARFLCPRVTHQPKTNPEQRLPK